MVITILMIGIACCFDPNIIVYIITHINRMFFCVENNWFASTTGQIAFIFFAFIAFNKQKHKIAGRVSGLRSLVSCVTFNILVRSIIFLKG